MKKIIERIVAGEIAPGHYDLWIDTNNGTPQMKVNLGESRGGWQTISGGSGGGENPGLMIIEGNCSELHDDAIFTPSANQPSFSDAVSHFLSGGALMAHVTSLTTIDGTVDYDCYLGAITATPSGEYAIIEFYYRTDVTLWWEPPYEG